MAIPRRQTLVPSRPIPQLKGWTRKFSSFLRFQRYRPDDVAVSTVIVALDGSGDFDDIQAAIDSLPSTGGIVQIKAGTYKISSQIDIRVSNTTIVGVGTSTKIIPVSSINQVFRVISLSNILIDNLFIDCDSLSGAGIDFFGTTFSTISRCIIENASANGITIHDSSEEIVIDGNQLSSNTQNGIIIATAKGIINDNKLIDNTKSGIVINLSSNCVISSNIVTGNGTGLAPDPNKPYSGILVQDDSNENIISSNTSVDNANAEIEIKDSNCDDNIITFNNCTSGTITDNGTNTQIGHNITS